MISSWGKTALDSFLDSGSALRILAVFYFVVNYLTNLLKIISQ